MYRYIALAWQGQDPQETEIAQRLATQLQPGWNTALKQPGFLFMYSAPAKGKIQTYPLPNNGQQPTGVILGQLFNKFQSNNLVTEFGLSETQKIINSKGVHLVEHYWGHYVAFITNQNAGEHFALRDPSGTLPCFYCNYQGVDIYFSHMDNLATLKGPSFSINWSFVHKYLLYPRTHCTDTGLNEVSKLLPGQYRLKNRTTTETTFYWDPVTISETNIIEDPEQAATELRRVTQECITAFASCYDSIIHRLSGGLDSTIVMGCLEQTRPRPDIHYLHYCSSELDSNERAIAQAAAEYSGVQLLERAFGSEDIDYTNLPTMPKTTIPADYYYGIGAAKTEARIARETGAEVFFSGESGDEIFYSSPSNLSAIDYAQRHGFGPQLLQAAFNAALISQTSLWAVLREVIKNRLLRLPSSTYTNINPHHSSMINRDIGNSISLADTQHPLLAKAGHLPPGKLIHVFSLSLPRKESELTRDEDYVQQLQPLYAQPLIELCLRIPTDVLAVDGRRRGLVRRAFKGMISPQVIKRESKGAGANHTRQVYNDNIAFIREWLMDGILTREKVLDRQLLEKSLTGNQSDITVNPVHLLYFMGIEKWLRDWVSD